MVGKCKEWSENSNNSVLFHSGTDCASYKFCLPRISFSSSLLLKELSLEVRAHSMWKTPSLPMVVLMRAHNPGLANPKTLFMGKRILLAMSTSLKKSQSEPWPNLNRAQQL